jgi:putative ABC transport system permease protein
VSLARLFRIVTQRVRAAVGKEALDAELDRELAFHYELLVREYTAEGMALPDAQHAARRALGNQPLLAEQCRDERRMSWLHDIRQDLAYGLRTLRRSPGVTTVAVLSLGIGIGVIAAVVGILDAVLVQQRLIPNDDRLFAARTYLDRRPDQNSLATIADYFAWADAAKTLDEITISLGGPADFSAEPGGPAAETIPGQQVSTNLLPLLAVKPILGRLFIPADDPLTTPAIILSHRLWTRRYGANPDIIGRVVTVNGVRYPIVGVMPERFHYPSDVVDYWVPMRPARPQIYGSQRFFTVTARLKDGVQRKQAEAELNTIAARLAVQSPATHAGWRVRLLPIREAMFGWTLSPLITLAIAVGLVLLTACANVAGLLLARGLARRPELALRAALGAGQERITRQLLTESVLLAAGAAIVGIGVSWVVVRVLSAMVPPPGGVAIGAMGLSPRMLLAGIVISLATVAFFGLVPALVGSRTNLTEPLSRGVRTTATRVERRVGSVLVGAQFAVTFVLLVVAALVSRSAWEFANRDVNFDTSRMLTFQINYPLAPVLKRVEMRSGDETAAVEVAPEPMQRLQQIYRDLHGVPGVIGVAGVSHQMVNSLVFPMVATAPVSGEVWTPIPRQSDGSNNAAHFAVTPHFFSTIGAHFRGRDINADDIFGAPWVAVINETAARSYWPGQNALGKRVLIGNSPDERPREVVGVIRDIPLRMGVNRDWPAVYTPYHQRPARSALASAALRSRMIYMVRAADDPLQLLPPVRDVVTRVDPDRPLGNVSLMDAQIESGVPARAISAVILGLFAAAAMILAAIGIYGVMAYSAAQRMPEIGVRLALGARRYEAVALVCRRAARVTGFGLVVGLIAALPASRLIASQLWNVGPTDLPSYAVSALILLLTAAIASIFPARRVLRVGLASALRRE